VLVEEAMVEDVDDPMVVEVGAGVVVVVETAPPVQAQTSRLTPHKKATRRISTSTLIVSPWVSVW
jgi:hypothetical protein